MRGSRKGVRYAVLGYVLIVIVVLGGMSWASSATWQLTQFRLREQHLERLRSALGRLDDYALGIWKVETGHEAEHYQAFFSIAPVFDREEGSELDPWRIVQLSPLAKYEPRFDWIDVYFQVNEAGEWTSPQLPNPEELSLWDPYEWDPIATLRARRALTWLRRSVPVPHLQARVNRAMEFHRLLGGGAKDPEATQMVLAGNPTPSGRRATGSLQERASLTNRDRSIRGARQKYVPEPKCLPADIAEQMVTRSMEYRSSEAADSSLRPSFVSVQCSTLVPVWLDSAADEPQKLAFVRTAQTASDTLYQGFLGDWDRLKRELLKRISDVFPQADLEPVILATDTAELESAELGEDEMEQLPVRLLVPQAVTGSAGDVWQSVRGVLLASWAAALTVLVAAGWGVRNLVALTERRLQFAYAVTHELRTPLTTFRLYTDLLSAGLVPEEKRQEYVDTLNKESQRLATLVEDVLEYARLENHKVRLNPVSLKGENLITKLREMFEARCSAGGVRAVAESHLPRSRTLRTDVDLVGQIAGVLVNNACRHARNATDPTVFLQLRGDNGHLTLDVMDNGPGIDRGDARKIFKPFRRGRNADTAAQGGIGLGLSLARSWAALLGGRLDLVARHHPNHGGAHFRLTIPSEVQG